MRAFLALEATVLFPLYFDDYGRIGGFILLAPLIELVRGWVFAPTAAILRETLRVGA